MKLSFIQPRAELKLFIQCFVVFESPIGMPASGTHLVAPDGCPRLIITIENSITSICKERCEENDEGGMYRLQNDLKTEKPVRKTLVHPSNFSE